MQTMNPVFHIERWGFVVLMKLPAAPLGGISVSLQQLRDIQAKANKRIDSTLDYLLKKLISYNHTRSLFEKN
jgi:hypothetical protein